MRSVAVALVVVLMILSQAPTETTTTECPDITCGFNCLYVVGPDGCVMCECHPTCSDMPCGPNEPCTMTHLCDQPVCFETPICIATTTGSPSTTVCPDMSGCIGTCHPVNSSSTDGCPVCLCVDPICGMVVICGPDEDCVLDDTAPLGAICVPKYDPCTGTPNTGRCSSNDIRRWTYNSVTDRCEEFRYYGCTPSPNTFGSRKACRNRCRAACTAVGCKDNCHAYRREKGCTKCICPNSCKELKCSKGFECKMQVAYEGPQPFCYPKHCPTPEPCGIRCMYGLKMDKNGCQLCECLKEAPTSH